MNQSSSLSKIFVGLIVTGLMLSMLAHHSAFGQFSTTLDEPTITEPARPSLGQNNTSSSSEEEELIITVLGFRPDGTGYLSFETNGISSPEISFNHSFTAENGYTINNGVPIFTNNRTNINPSSIDFSSQIVIDPNANVTLPSKPKISPVMTEYYSEIGALVSSNPFMLQQPGPQPQPQQPGPSQPPPTATIPPPTAGTATDPELQQFDQIANGCEATIQRLYPGAKTSDDIFLIPPQGATYADFAEMTQCYQLMSQAIEQYCYNFQTYDAAKCAYVRTPENLNLYGMLAIIANSEFLF